MRTLIIILGLLSPLLLGAPSYSRFFDKGFTAYKNGDYATALKEWKILAEKGVARAQKALGHLYYSGRGVTFDSSMVKNLLLIREMQTQRNFSICIQ